MHQAWMPANGGDPTLHVHAGRPRRAGGSRRGARISDEWQESPPLRRPQSPAAPRDRPAARAARCAGRDRLRGVEAAPEAALRAPARRDAAQCAAARP